MALKKNNQLFGALIRRFGNVTRIKMPEPKSSGFFIYYVFLLESIVQAKQHISWSNLKPMVL